MAQRNALRRIFRATKKARCDRCERSSCGVEEFQKSREKVLGRVFAAERGERGGDLAGRAVDGRNENQQQE